MKTLSRLASIVGFALAASFLTAQAENVVLKSVGDSDKDIRVGVYINVLSDCSLAPLPNIRLITPPAHGKVVVKKANFNATNFKQCLAITAPAYIAFYHSEKDFTGTDSLVLEVHYPGKKEQTQHIDVTVQAPGQAQGPHQEI